MEVIVLCPTQAVKGKYAEADGEQLEMLVTRGTEAEGILEVGAGIGPVPRDDVSAGELTGHPV